MFTRCHGDVPEQGRDRGREGEKWLHVLEMTSGIFIPAVFTLGLPPLDFRG